MEYVLCRKRLLKWFMKGLVIKTLLPYNLFYSLWVTDKCSGGIYFRPIVIVNCKPLYVKKVRIGKVKIGHFHETCVHRNNRHFIRDHMMSVLNWNKEKYLAVPVCVYTYCTQCCLQCFKTNGFQTTLIALSFDTSSNFSFWSRCWIALLKTIPVIPSLI